MDHPSPAGTSLERALLVRQHGNRAIERLLDGVLDEEDGVRELATATLRASRRTAVSRLSGCAAAGLDRKGKGFFLGFYLELSAKLVAPTGRDRTYRIQVRDFIAR